MNSTLSQLLRAGLPTVNTAELSMAECRCTWEGNVESIAIVSLLLISHLTEGLAQNDYVETQFLKSRETKVTCIMQVPKLTSLPGLQACTLKSGWNAQFCGMDVLDFKLSNLLNSQTLEISQSFLCSNRIRDCRKKSVSKKLYLGNLHSRTLGGNYMATFHKAPPYRTQTEEKISFHTLEFDFLHPYWSLKSDLEQEKRSRTMWWKSWGKSADESCLLLKRAKKAHLMEGTSQCEQKAEQGQ